LSRSGKSPRLDGGRFVVQKRTVVLVLPLIPLALKSCKSLALFRGKPPWLGQSTLNSGTTNDEQAKWIAGGFEMVVVVLGIRLRAWLH
jgi:hypothetical protein